MRSTPYRVWILLVVLAVGAVSAITTAARTFVRFPPARPPRVAALRVANPVPYVADPESGAIVGSPGAAAPELEATPEPASTPAPAHAGVALTVPILLYHYVRTNPEHPGAPGWELSVGPEEFARQMAYAGAAGIHTVTLAEVMSALAGGPPLPSHPVVLTFDDGYADFATTAAPILERYHMTGTDYVVPGFLGRPSYMTAGQVREVASHGMVIGAHTMHHVSLAKIAPDLAATEITDSKSTLETLLGHPVADFAYPYGDYNGEVVTEVVAAGFRDAVTTKSGESHSLGTRFELSRLRVGASDTVASFARKAMLPPPPPEWETVGLTLPAVASASPTATPSTPLGTASPATLPAPASPRPSTLILNMPTAAVTPDAGR